MALAVVPFRLGGAAGGPDAAALAAKLSGRWTLNRELSPDLVDPGRRPGGRRGAFVSYGVVHAVLQRGGRGRGGGGGDGGPELSPPSEAETAAQSALSLLQQVPVELTIDASPSQITFVEPRGRSVFQIDGRSATVDVPGGTIKVKSRWDSASLRQEFSSVQRMLRRSWTIDAANHLVLTQRLESLAFVSKESRAIYDRQ
jgi:hypothetical protein